MNRRTVLVLPFAVAAGCAGRTFDLNFYRSSALIGDAFVEASLAETEAFQQSLIRPDVHIDIQRVFWGVGHSLIALQDWLLKGDGKQSAAQVSALLDSIASLNAKLIIVPDSTRALIGRGVDAARSTLAIWSMFIANVNKPDRTLADFTGNGKKLALRSFDVLSTAPGIASAQVSTDVLASLGDGATTGMRADAILQATLYLGYDNGTQTLDVVPYRRSA